MTADAELLWPPAAERIERSSIKQSRPQRHTQPQTQTQTQERMHVTKTTRTTNRLASIKAVSAPPQTPGRRPRRWTS